MPTGRPDYWYGTALYFDDSPGDGELTRGPTANWAYDHVNNPSAHHVKAGGGDVDHADITNVLASQHHTKYSDAEALSAVRAIVDDTPVDAATTEPISSNWAFDHKALPSVHHSKYTDAEALTQAESIIDDTPANADVTHSPSSNWAFDHNANNSAHHPKYHEKYESSMLVGNQIGAAGARSINFYPSGNTTSKAYVQRSSGDDGYLLFGNIGAGHMTFTVGGAQRFAILATGGVANIWDDTPTDGETNKGTTSNWAYDHVNDHLAHGATFVDRGDQASLDWTHATLTEDSTWRDLNLSSVVPAGAIAVLFRVSVNYTTPGDYLMIQEKGNTNGVNRGIITAQVSGVSNRSDMIVACDGSRFCEYKATASPTAIEISICGWWI